MSTTATEILSKLEGVKKTAAGHQARCPAHPDDRASLSISVGDNGGLVVHCHANCETADVMRAIGLTMADLRPSTNGHANGNGKPSRRIVAEYSYHGPAGNLLYQAVRFEPKDFRQRAPKPGGGWTWKLNGVARVLYGLPKLLAADTGATVYIPEGEKDCDALTALGLIATCNVGGAGKWRGEYSEHFHCRNVVVFPDNDETGRKHAEAVANSLAPLATTVKVVELPGLPSKGDVSDWLAGGGTLDALAALVTDAPEWTPTKPKHKPRANQKNPEAPRDSKRPTITITTDEPVVVDQAIEALALDPTIFKRGNVLACVMRDDHQTKGVIRPPDAPRIQPLPLPTLRERLAGQAKWIKIQEKGDKIQEVAAHPPDWAVKAVAARGEWSAIRPIEGVVETPILRPDGTLLTLPGYDAETGLLYEPRGSFPDIPAAPTLADAQRARDVLLEVVEDFPFARDEHRSGWLAGLLTPLARYSFHGPAPMFVFDANTRGAGKTLGCDTIGQIVSGWPMARMVNPESDDEMRKRITTLALEGERLVLLDNIGNTLGSPSLDAALTATTWKDRVLGVNRSTAAVPLNATWYATGNNIVFNGDTIRRVVPIRIESDMERPEERHGFRHPDLLDWIRQERGRLVAAALTILRAYHVAGRPNQGLTTWGSYEAWSAAVRQPIAWVGLVDPAVAREELAEQSDREAGSLRALLAAWHDIAGGEGLTVPEVFRMLEANTVANRVDDSRHGHETLKWPALRAAIAEISGKPLGQLPSPRSFGMRLTHMRGRVVGGRRLIGKPDRTGAIVWRVETAGTADTAGTIPPQPQYVHARTHAHESGQNTPFSPSSPSSDEAIGWEDALEP
jgi:hypothetical protein